MRIAGGLFALLAFLAVLAGAVYVGTRLDDADDANAKTETLERVQNADVSKGDAKEDRDWILDFVDGLQ